MQLSQSHLTSKKHLMKRQLIEIMMPAMMTEALKKTSAEE